MLAVLWRHEVHVCVFLKQLLEEVFRTENHYVWVNEYLVIDTKLVYTLSL